MYSNRSSKTKYLVHMHNILCLLIFRGVGACEVLAMELKSRGLFVSRHISLANVEIEQIEVAVNNAVGGNHFEILYKRVSQIVSLSTKLHLTKHWLKITVSALKIHFIATH